MWDYDKLFAEGNIVGLTIEDGEDIYNQVVSNPDYWRDGQEINWNLYKNEKLSSCEETGFEFKIQYIIRLDEHGNVIEKLFDRERDMKPEAEPMPELKDGMFIRVAFKDNYLEQDFGFISLILKQIIYQHEGYDWIDNIKYWKNTKIIEIYSPEVLSFKNCQYSVPIWRSPEYQNYLDSKTN